MSMGRRSAASAHGTAKASLPVHPRIPPVKSPVPPFRAWPCGCCGRWRHPPNPPVSPCSTPGQAPVHPRTPARTRKIPPPRPASRARPPPPPPRIRTRSVSTRQGRVRKMIPVSVCGPCGPEVLAALPLIQHRCDKVNTLVRDPARFFCHFRDSRPAISISDGLEIPVLPGRSAGRRRIVRAFRTPGGGGGARRCRWVHRFRSRRGPRPTRYG